MSEFPTASFESWRHHDIQNEPVDTAGLPFRDEFLDSTIPAIISQEAAAILPPDSLPLGQVSPTHARSYQIRLGKLANDGDFQQNALWQDRYGNQFTNLTLKGNNFRRQEIFASLTAPSGYVPYGLMEDDALLRVLRSSRLLREAGVDTEWPVRIVEPKQLMFGSERVSQLEYKKRLVEQVLAGAEDFDEAAKIANAITDMSFFVVARAMKLADRPADFLEDKTTEAAQKRLNRVFSIYNQTHRADSDYRSLDASSIDDRSYYASKLLPRLLARNLAKLHNAGLAHSFPVIGNVSALGGLVDLDSVRGEPLELGDAPVGFSEWRRDIQQLFDDEYDLLAVQTRLENQELVKVVDHPVKIFFDEYITSRGWDIDNNSKEVLQMAGAFSLTQLGVDYFRLAAEQLIGELRPPKAALHEMRRKFKQLEPKYFYDYVDALVHCLDIKIREFGPRNFSQDDEEFSDQFDKFLRLADKGAEWIYSSKVISEFENDLPQLVQSGELREWLAANDVDEATAPLVARACLADEVSGTLFNDVSKQWSKAYNTSANLAASRYFDRLCDRIDAELPAEFDELLAPDAPQPLFNGNFITIAQRLSADKLVDVARRAGIKMVLGGPGVNENESHVIEPAEIDGETYLPLAAFTDGDYAASCRDEKYELNKTYLKLDNASYSAWLVGPKDKLRLYVNGPAELLAALVLKPA